MNKTLRERTLEFDQDLILGKRNLSFLIKQFQSLIDKYEAQGLIEGQSLLEISKLFERLHKKYSSDYDIVCLEGFNVVGYN